MEQYACLSVAIVDFAKALLRAVQAALLPNAPFLSSIPAGARRIIALFSEREGYLDVSISTADYLMTAAVMEKKVQFAQSVWDSIPEAWRRVPRMYCGIWSLKLSLASFVMLLFSQRLLDEGKQILSGNGYEKSACKDSSVNWKLLKGLELAGKPHECLAFANHIRSLAHSENSISSSLCMDAIISCYCKEERFKDVLNWVRTMKRNSLKMEQSTYDSILTLYVSTDRWKTVYEKMKGRAQEKGLSLRDAEFYSVLCFTRSDKYLKWKAREYFFFRAADFFYDKMHSMKSRFFFIDGDSIRSWYSDGVTCRH